MVTTKDSAQQASVTSRATGRTGVKPVVVDKYNQSMNSVDLVDQYTVYYSFVRRSKKWWRKVCFSLLEVATVNAYMLYKTSNSSHTHQQFRRAVIESLASLHLQEQSCQVSRIRRDSHTLDNTLTLSRLTCRNEVKSHT